MLLRLPSRNQVRCITAQTSLSPRNIPNRNHTTQTNPGSTSIRTRNTGSSHTTPTDSRRDSRRWCWCSHPLRGRTLTVFLVHVWLVAALLLCAAGRAAAAAKCMRHCY